MGKKNYIKVSIAFLVVILVSGSMAEEAKWLRYQTSGEARNIIGDIGSVSPELTFDKPEGVELFKFKGSKPLFAKWVSPMAQKGHLWIAFDCSGKAGSYDTLYIDSDGDDSLKDETALKSSRAQHNRPYFGPVKVVFDGADGKITYHLNIDLYVRGNNKYLWIYPGCWYEGVVKPGEQRKYCVLIDYNVNGTFNDKSINASECDRVRVGKKGDRYSRFVGNYIEIDDSFYNLEIARDGAWVKFSKAEDLEFGSIEIPEIISKFTAGGENGLFDVSLKNGTGSLPVGKYRVDSWMMRKKDEKGRLWQLQARGYNSSGNFEVETGEKTTLDIGEPMTGRLAVSSSGDNYNFNKSLQGRLGEWLDLTCEGKRVTFRMNVKSEDGKFNKTYALEDG